MMKNTLLFLINFSIIVLFAENEVPFSDGPYGTIPFQTVAPFTLPDLNGIMQGDLNWDRAVDVSDIILVVSMILEQMEQEQWHFFAANTNLDDQINLLDVISTINIVLNGSEPEILDWNFQNMWTGRDCYLFLRHVPDNNYSNEIWGSSAHQMIVSSPENVHYFFLTDEENVEDDLQSMINHFEAAFNFLNDEIIMHWRPRIHYIPVTPTELENGVETVLAEWATHGFAIDRYQRFREIGYLRKPDTFTDATLKYLKNDAVYFNYEFDSHLSLALDGEVVTLFDSTLFNGGWSAWISSDVTLPTDDELDQFDGMQIEFIRNCQGYLDQNCAEYDYLVYLLMCEIDEGGNETNCREVARWITPFGRSSQWITDISSMLALIRPGGDMRFKFNSNYPNDILDMNLRLLDFGTGITPKGYQTLWSGGLFNENYNENHEPIQFEVPDNCEKVEIVAFITGHGYGYDNQNCAEFCNHTHHFFVNETEFVKSHPESDMVGGCLDCIYNGGVPNQYGTWGYGRGGWCPGLDVEPWVVDITDYVQPGENTIEYIGLFNGNDNWPIPEEDPQNGFPAIIEMNSYLVFWQ